MMPEGKHDKRSKRESAGPSAALVKDWETLEDELVADCQVFEVRRRLRRSPVSGNQGHFHGLTCANWVNTLPLTDDGHVVLIRQYRHGSDEITLEIPGGVIDTGELPEEAGVRELLEETGYRPASASVIGCVRSNPALVNNSAYTVLATGVEPVARPDLDELEEITVELYALKEVDTMLRNGEIKHALTVNAFLWYRLWLEEVQNENGS